MSDDLDAFFDEVSEVEAKAKEDEEPPPSKKPRLDFAARGVVVASAASVIPKLSDADDNKAQLQLETKLSSPTIAAAAPAPPPPPPPVIKYKSPAHSEPSPANETTTFFDNIDDWPTNGFRLFVGNLANEVADHDLYEHFSKYPSLQRARIIRDVKKLGKSKGFGFVQFGDALESARAKREMDQSWLSSRPIRIKKYQGTGTTIATKNTNHRRR